MIEISEKPDTVRTAMVSAIVRMNPQTAQMIADGKVLKGGVIKGDMLAALQVAAYFAIKRIPDLLPLCHPIPISNPKVKFDFKPEEGLLCIEVIAKCTAQTEAGTETLTGAAISALTVYDMCKGIEPSIIIERIQLERKSDDKLGEWMRP